jgi:hypothetical protein
MIKLAAMRASMSFLELKSKYFHGVLTLGTDISFFFLAPFTSIKMFGQNIVLLLEGGPFMSIIDVVKVFEGEEVLLETVVEFLFEQGLHQLQVAD